MSIRQKIASVIAPGMVPSEEIKDLIDTAVESAVKTARMSAPVNYDYDPNGEGYRRMSSGGNDQGRAGMSSLSQDVMLQTAYNLYDTSGLVKRFVRDTKNFVLGEGLTVEVENDTDDGAAKQLLDDYMSDWMNQVEARMSDRVEFFGLLGEQCYPVTVNPVNGRVWNSYIDPQNIDAVGAVAGFPEMPGHVKLRGKGARDGKTLAVIRPELNPHLETYGYLVGDCFYFSTNKPPNDTRGRSDLLHLFDFINGFEDGLFDELDRIKGINAYIWDVTLNGATEEEIRDFLDHNKTPKANSVRAHNEQVTWQAVSPSLNHGDNKQFFDLMKTYLCACMNRPDSWLGSGGKVYQSEADLQGEPTFKDLGFRQKNVKYMYEFQFQYVLDQGVIHKVLSRPKAEKYKAVVNMPEMSTKDITKTTTSLFQLAQSLMIAETGGWVTKETSIKLYTSVAGQIGVDIDTSELIRQAAKETDPNVTKDYEGQEALINEIVARIEKKNAPPLEDEDE